METLTKRSFVAFLWSAFGQFTNQIISFVIGIILARIIDPREYGLLAMALIFNSITSAFIDGGFGSALIRKQNHTKADLSTVFYFNNVVSMILYLIFFFLAQDISSFFNQPELVSIIRILSINFLVTSLGAVQNILYIKRLEYKTQTLIRIISVLISGIVGVFLAVKNYGVWSLVVQIILQNCIWVALLWSKSSWRPSLCFSINSLKELFSYGSKVMLSSFIYQLFSQLYNFVFSKFFSIVQLSYYNRAESYQRITSLTITNMVNSIVFPTLSLIQNDDERLKQGIRRVIKITMLITVPLMSGFILLASPLISLLITDKWLPVVPILQLLCLAGIFQPLQSIIMNVFMVKGRSDYYLYIVIVKEIIAVVALIIGYHWGLFGVVISQVITSVLAFVIGGYFAGRFIKLSLYQQLLDILPFFVLSFTMFILGYGLSVVIADNVSKIIVIVVTCTIYYYLIAKYLKFSALVELMSLISCIIKK